MGVIRREEDYGSYTVYGESNTSFFKKAPTKEMLSTCGMFSAEITIRFNHLVKESVKGAPTAQIWVKRI